jgi:hypothetical protein
MIRIQRFRKAGNAVLFIWILALLIFAGGFISSES